MFSDARFLIGRKYMSANEIFAAVNDINAGGKIVYVVASCVATHAYALKIIDIEDSGQLTVSDGVNR